MSRGKYIVLEGGDGTGKSTLARNICKQENISYQAFPSILGTVGWTIRSCLKGDSIVLQKAYLYLFAADAVERSEYMEKILDSGINIVCDRHPLISGRIFQSFSQSEQQIDSVHTSMKEDGVRMPDHLFILQAPPSVVTERMKTRAKKKDVVFESYNEEHNKKLADMYLDVARDLDGIILDATKSIDELTEEVVKKAGIG